MIDESWHTTSVFSISEPLSTGYAPLWYGYVDESGDPAPFSAQPLILAAVLTQLPRQLELLVRKTARATGIKSRGGELKGSSQGEKIVRSVLTGVAKLPVKIYCFQLDKKAILKPAKNAEDFYVWTATQMIRRYLHHHPRLVFHFDKRYTNPEQQIWFERTVRDGLTDMSGISLVLRQEDSTKFKQLQIADFLAWSFSQKERGDDSYEKIIQEKVVVREILKRELWL